MKLWTIAEMVLGGLAIGVFGMVTFSVSPIWEILLGALIAAVVVVGVKTRGSISKNWGQAKQILKTHSLPYFLNTDKYTNRH